MAQPRKSIKQQNENQLIQSINQYLLRTYCVQPGANSEDKASRLPSWSARIPEGLLQNKSWTEAAWNRFNRESTAFGVLVCLQQELSF